MNILITTTGTIGLSLAEMGNKPITFFDDTFVFEETEKLLKDYALFKRTRNYLQGYLQIERDAEAWRQNKFDLEENF